VKLTAVNSVTSQPWVAEKPRCFGSALAALVLYDDVARKGRQTRKQRGMIGQPSHRVLARIRSVGVSGLLFLDHGQREIGEGQGAASCLDYWQSLARVTDCCARRGKHPEKRGLAGASVFVALPIPAYAREPVIWAGRECLPLISHASPAPVIC